MALAASAFVAVVAIALAAAVVAFQASYASRLYPGVRALGVPIGGLSREDARARLADRVNEMSNRSLVIGVNELSWSIAGLHLGVRSDVDPILDEAWRLGREGSLFQRVRQQADLAVNGAAYEIVAPAYDADQLRQFMQALAGAVDRPVRDAGLSLTREGAVEFVEGQAGRKLLVDGTRRRLEAALTRPDVTFVELAVEEMPPKIGTEDLAAARAQAETLVSGPIILKHAEAEWQLGPSTLVTMAEVTAADGVRLNREAVRTWATKLAKDVEQEPQSARFSWSNGKVSVLRPSKEGRKLDVDRVTELVLATALSTDRVAALPVEVSRPEVSEQDGEKLKIQGAIEVGRTSFAGSSPPKQHNINLATERLNGVVVPPGKLFSFNKEVGSTSLDAGYQLGWGIANAGANVKTVPSVAGGICQVATTLFHAVFFSGYQIEQRNYHLYWIPGYAAKGVEGVDATVDEESGLDFQFINNTENYLLIQSWTEGGRVVFGLYGTKPDWTVKITPGDRTDVVDASREQVVEQEPSLPLGQRLAVEGAMDGFKIANIRTVTRGADERVLRLTSVYRPSRNVVLEGTGGRPAAPSQTVQNRPAPAAEQPSPRATAAPAPSSSQSSATPAAKPTSPPATAAPATRAPATAAPANVAPATAVPVTQPAPVTKPIIQPGRQPGGGPAILPAPSGVAKPTN